MGKGKWGSSRYKRGETAPGLPERRASLPGYLQAAGAQFSGEEGGPTGREQARYFVAGLPIQAGGGHVAGPIRTAAGQEDQVTGEGLVLLDHDDVPDLQDTWQTAL